MGQNADEFPQSAMLGDNAVRVEMDASVLLGGINRAVFATADDELRPVMNGIYLILPQKILQWWHLMATNWCVAKHWLPKVMNAQHLFCPKAGFVD